MKKYLLITFIGLLISNCALQPKVSDQSDIRAWGAKNNDAYGGSIRVDPTRPFNFDEVKKTADNYCVGQGSRKAINVEKSSAGSGMSWYFYSFNCSPAYEKLVAKQKDERKKQVAAEKKQKAKEDKKKNSFWNFGKKTNPPKNNLPISTQDKITQAKQICRDLGFKRNTEKFSDCSLKMMSMQFNSTEKVAKSDGGTSQQVYIQNGNDYDLFDAMIDIGNSLRTGGSSSSSSGSIGTNCRVVQRAYGAEMFCN